MKSTKKINRLCHQYFAGSKDNASQQFCQVALLHECLHCVVLVCLVGLDTLGTRDRLDGVARHQPPAGVHRSGVRYRSVLPQAWYDRAGTSGELDIPPSKPASQTRKVIFGIYLLSISSSHFPDTAGF